MTILCKFDDGPTETSALCLTRPEIEHTSYISKLPRKSACFPLLQLVPNATGVLANLLRSQGFDAQQGNLAMCIKRGIVDNPYGSLPTMTQAEITVSFLPNQRTSAKELVMELPMTTDAAASASSSNSHSSVESSLESSLEVSMDRRKEQLAREIAIETLAKEAHVDAQHIRELYDRELKQLSAKAKIKTYVPVIAARLVRVALRREGAMSLQ